MNIKNCSICDSQPFLDKDDNQFMLVCKKCELDFKNIDNGVCEQTFQWRLKEDAVNEWNSIVDNNNSWYTKEYQRQHPIQTKLL